MSSTHLLDDAVQCQCRTARRPDSRTRRSDDYVRNKLLDFNGGPLRVALHSLAPATMAQLKDKVKNTLDEGRILVIGSQVFTGFQFRAVFEPGFEHLSGHAKYLEVAGLGLMVLAVALLIWPATYHQLIENGEDTENVYRFTSAVLAAAILPFALALGIDFLVGAEFLFGRTEGLVAGAIGFATAILFWYVLQLVHRQKHSQEIERERKLSEQQQQKQGSGTELKDKIQQVLTEVRVALPGAQALMGFQFISLFMEAFQKLPQSLKIIHFIALCLVGLTIIILMTPASYHRIVERGEETERFHHFASRVLLWALVPLALGITGDFYVVVHKVTGSGIVAGSLAALAMVILYGLWFGYAFQQRKARGHTRKQIVNVDVRSWSE
jgi:hypothetical protein